MKKYSTLLTADYLLDWSITNGVREFVANWLDSSATSEYEFTDSSIALTSKGVQLSSKCLAFGQSGNRSNPDAVGQHGEGILAGCIPILRAGIHIEMRNGDVLWTPTFEYNEDLGVECLVINETPLPGNTDYTVFIEGLTTEDIDQVKEGCLYLRDDLGEVLVGTKGRVLKGIAGKLYVGGIYVCEIGSHIWSYDFNPKYLPLNRDRKNVNTWDLTKNTSELLEEVLPSNEVATMVKDRVMDVGCSWYSIKPKSQAVAEESYKLFKADHGATAIICDTYSEQEKLEKRGFKKVVVISDDNYRQMVEQSVEYQELKEELEEYCDAPKEVDQRSPVELLEAWYGLEDMDGNKGWGNLEKLIDLFKLKGVSWDTDLDEDDVIPV